MNKKMLPGFCAIVTGLLVFSIGCSSNLTSDGYWHGAENEVHWAEQHFSKGSTGEAKILDTNDDNAYRDPLPAPENPLKKKYRIAVVISGNYWEFFDNLKGFVEGMSNIGWADSIIVPPSIQNTAQLLSWIDAQKWSRFIEFAPEFFVNLQWGENMDTLRRLFFDQKPNVDLILAYGGMAASAFYKSEKYPIPVLADAITDPYSAGVTKTLEDSGRDFFSCRIDPDIFKQQIRLFHNATGFKKLGIVYGDDEYGIIYGAVRTVEEMSKELGFEIIKNTNVKESMSSDTTALYLEALDDVASKADAVYIGASTAVTEYNIMPEIIAILDKYKKPSFSLEGTIRVKDGILFSLSASGLTRAGIYTATKATHIFQGVSPRRLSQYFESVPTIAINLATARAIGYKPPIDVLINSDEVYLDRNNTIHSRYSESGATTSSGIFSDFSSPVGNDLYAYFPHKRSDGKPFKIAILQSGTYWEFFEHFKGIVKGLQSSEWIDPDITIPENIHTIEGLLDSLGDNYSDYLEFDNTYNINIEWGAQMQRADIFFADVKPPVDMILSFGGVAGKLFAPLKNYDIPVLIEAITDPIGSGIVYSAIDSGKDFLTCRVDLNQFRRQIELFYNITDFKTLGLIYGDDEYGRLYSAVNDVEFMSRKLDFSIARNTSVSEKVSPETPAQYLEALESICQQADAVYIGAATAITEYNIIKQVADILIRYKKPSFALEGEIRVNEGILMGVSALETEKIGIYNAMKIAAIFSGRQPRSLPQEFEGVPSVAFNVTVAGKIGMNIPLDTLSSIDHLIY